MSGKAAATQSQAKRNLDAAVRSLTSGRARTAPAFGDYVADVLNGPYRERVRIGTLAPRTFDLYERAVNDLLYDPATRTYRLQLGDLPPWVAALATATDQARRGTIMAELTTVGAETERYTIRGEATLRP